MSIPYPRLKALVEMDPLEDPGQFREAAYQALGELRLLDKEYNQPIPEDSKAFVFDPTDTIMGLEEFESALECGMFTDYDGHGVLTDLKIVSKKPIDLGTFNKTSIEERGFTHVIWYNK